MDIINMKKLILIIIFILSFQSLGRANDIRDFEIEGISIGDSALNFFTKDIIEKNVYDYYKDKTFSPVQTQNLPFYEIYDYVDFDFKTNDKNFIIHALYGTISYENNISDCYKQMDDIVIIMKNLFEDSATMVEEKAEKRPEKTGDPTGKTIATSVSFWFDNGDRASVTCYDYSNEYGGEDNLSVGVQTHEQNEFLFNKAY
jgi:hypothetical protein